MIPIGKREFFFEILLLLPIVKEGLYILSGKSPCRNKRSGVHLPDGRIILRIVILYYFIGSIGNKNWSFLNWSDKIRLKQIEEGKSMTGIRRVFTPVDMTIGVPWQDILIFSIPMIVGNFAQQLYNTVDSIVVGRYIGDKALAAVGSANPILNLLLVIFMGIAVGTSVMISQYFGARESENIAETLGTCITITGLMSVVIMILCIFVTRPLLVLLHTPDSIIDWCASYLIIYFLGVAGVAYYNILSGILRGLGDSISALLYLLVSTFINIILDIWFVAGFHWGVSGVALATIIAQAVSAVLCFIKLFRMHQIFVLKFHHLKIKREYILEIIRIGLPTGITQAVFSTAMLLVQSLTNSYGEMFIAASVIVMRVDGFAMMPNFSFGSAMTTYTGQNIGAKKMDRVQEGAKQGTRIAVIISASITMMILIFGRSLMGIFTNTKELVDLSMRMMRILSVGYITFSIGQSFSGVMRGAGDTVTPMWIAIISTVFIRIPTAYGIAWFTRTPDLPYGRCESVYISLLVSWSLGALITYLFYKKGKWKNKAVV